MGDAMDPNFASSEGQQMSYNQQPSPMAPPSDWHALDDHYNMIDENMIEPDYYIDQPVSYLLNFNLTHCFWLA